MLVGIGLIGVLTATVASYFVEEKTGQEKAELNQRAGKRATSGSTRMGSTSSPDQAAVRMSSDSSSI
jgi:hypothetical protein